MSSRSSTKEFAERGAARPWGVFGVVLIVGFVFAGWLILGAGPAGEEASEAAFVVNRGPLRISTTVSGQIKAKDQVVIVSELEGQNAILFVQPEGTPVKKGELLVELDASSLMDRRVDQEIRVQNADAAFVSARENLEVVKNQAQSDVEQAELDLKFAKQDLEKFEEGELPREIMAAESTITLAEEELSRAEEKYKWSKILFDEKYLSQTELQADELAANQARLSLELAQTDLRVLVDYTAKKARAEFVSAVRQADMALDRVRRKANADVVQAEATYRARTLEFEREKGKLQKLEEQIEKAKIRAPMDGLVVYASSTKTSWRGGGEPLEEGQMVRERQELIHLPTTEEQIAEVRIHESFVNKMTTGLKAEVNVDALPGKIYEGHVESIAVLPDATSVFMNPDLKVYDTVIAIHGDDPRVRNGMSCEAEIIIAEYEDAVFVPVQAVMRVGGVPTVYVDERGEWVPRTIEPGMDNNRMMHVLEGLEDGERVLLTPPLDEGAESTDGVSSPGVERPALGGETSPESDASNTEGNLQSLSDPSREAPRGAADSRRVGEGSPQTGMTSDPARDEMRKRFESMSPEQREEMMRDFQEMGPEERARLREQFGGGSGQRPGAGAGGRDGG